MSVFVLLAVLLLALACAFVIYPLLSARTSSARAPLAALLSVVLLLLSSVAVYAWLGNRSGLRASASDTAGSTATLARHLEEQPQDENGWISLGAAYAAIGQSPLALRAYERANRLSSSTDERALTGIAEALLMSGDQAEEAKASEFIERALVLNPKSPRALFYGAVLAYTQGRLEIARTRFTDMLSLTPPPPPNVRTALQKQIDDIDARLHPKVDAATAIHLHVTLAQALAAKVPANASLFVFVRSPGGGAPLAVKRSAVSLPQDVDLSASDSMIAGHAVQPGQKVSVVARISASGSPLPQSGDLYGQIEYVAGKSGARALQIDQLSP